MLEYLSYLSTGDWLGIASLALLFLLSLSNVVSKKETPSIDGSGKNWNKRLSLEIFKSRGHIWEKLMSLSFQRPLDSKAMEEIEELLYEADIGSKIIEEFMAHLQEKGLDFQQGQFQEVLKDFLKGKMQSVQTNNDQALFQYKQKEECRTIMIVGVNGVGKTTTIGKLATKFSRQGAKVVVGACDTFRAAAADQLQVWCDRANVKMIRGKQGTSPSGVGYETLQTALRDHANYCLLDTAGRVHTAKNLMTELLKSKNVLGKLHKNAPNHILLVLDAISGQNSLRQAQEFHQTLGVTGLIFTKCDGSSRAGSAIGIVDALQIPITYIGVGEGIEDLNIFCLEDYLDGLLRTEDRQTLVDG